MKNPPPDPERELRAAFVAVHQALLQQGWELVPPEVLLSCPRCRAVVPFTDATEHMEVLHPEI